MSPTELFYDEAGGSYIRLLPIETRLEDAPLNALKQDGSRWTQINLDPDSPEQMQEVFQELVAVKLVPKVDAIALGLIDDREATGQTVDNSGQVEIPRWRLRSSASRIPY